ncbi:MAG TPA: hypothetical protein PK185_13020 [Cyclobacteriaceae bacterium]|nr:hypothetical protein [Cyclobacteriaceae bacterium]HRK54834.1 hypothetical protein [Cyclobacteriaceae bacterium]
MKRFLKTLAILIVIYILLVRVISLLDLPHQQESDTDWEIAYCDEYSLTDSISQNEIRLTHHRAWNNYSFDSLYCLSYTLSSSTSDLSKVLRERIFPQERSYESYWRHVYYELHSADKENISFLQDSLQQVATKNKLTRNELAKLIVSFVQDIPYSYVMPGPCDKTDHPCLDNEKFGILSPVEFLYTLTGDCDTRSVLLYSLLKHFGYDALIMISNEYRHAMIAIDLPASGDHIIYKGKKFYFWETTNTGWLPGMLPPDTNNIAYWNITLDHEYQAITSRHR